MQKSGDMRVVEAVTQMGGEQRAAQGLLQSQLRMTKTPSANAVLAAMFVRGEGEFDPTVLSDLASGRRNLTQLMGEGGALAGMGAKQMTKFLARREEMIGEMSPLQLQMMNAAIVRSEMGELYGPDYDTREEMYEYLRTVRKQDHATAELVSAQAYMDPSIFMEQHVSMIEQENMLFAKESARLNDPRNIGKQVGK